MNQLRSLTSRNLHVAGMAITSLPGERREKFASGSCEIKEGFTEEGTLDLDLQQGETFATSSCEEGRAPRPWKQPTRRYGSGKAQAAVNIPGRLS